jgi:hypothetical protein
MSSWITCRCGRQLHTNLASERDLRLVIHEAALEAPRDHLTAEQVVASLVLGADTLLRCEQCERLILLTRNGTATFYRGEGTA